MVIRVKLFTHKPSQTITNWHCMVSCMTILVGVFCLQSLWMNSSTTMAIGSGSDLRYYPPPPLVPYVPFEVYCISSCYYFAYRGAVVAQWIGPLTLNCEVPGSNLLAVAGVSVGKAPYPHCLVPRKGLKAVGPIVACLY